MQGVRGQAVAGEPGAMQQLVTLDPAQAKQVQDYLKSADEQEIERMKQMNDNSGRMASVVLSSSNPERSYELYRNSMPQEYQAQMPEQYDEEFVRFQVARAREMEDILANPEISTFGGEDVMMQGGEIIGRTPSENALKRQTPEEYTLSPGAERRRGDQVIARNPKAADGSNSSLNASDENAMFRQSVELLGGLFDAQGNMQALDPTLRSKAQAIATEASRLFTQGGMTRTQAVTNAAQQMGIQFPSGGGQPRPAPAPTQPGANALQYTQQNPARPATPQEYDTLPSGSVFIDPGDGQLYRKP